MADLNKDKKKILQDIGLIGEIYKQSYSLKQMIEGAVRNGKDANKIIEGLYESIRAYQNKYPDAATSLLNELASISAGKEVAGNTLEAEGGGTQAATPKDLDEMRKIIAASQGNNEEEPPANPFEDLPESPPVPETKDPQANWKPKTGTGESKLPDWMASSPTPKTADWAKSPPPVLPTPKGADSATETTPKVEAGTSFLPSSEVVVNVPKNDSSVESGSVSSSPQNEGWFSAAFNTIKQFFGSDSSQENAPSLPPRITKRNGKRTDSVVSSSGLSELPTPSKALETSDVSSVSQGEEEESESSGFNVWKFLAALREEAAARLGFNRKTEEVGGTSSTAGRPKDVAHPLVGGKVTESELADLMKALSSSGSSPSSTGGGSPGSSGSSPSSTGGGSPSSAGSATSLGGSSSGIPTPSSTTSLTGSSSGPSSTTSYSGSSSSSSVSTTLVNTSSGGSGGPPSSPGSTTATAPGGSSSYWNITTPDLDGFRSGLAGLFDRIFSALGSSAEQLAQARLHQAQKSKHKAQADIYQYPIDLKEAENELYTAETDLTTATRTGVGVEEAKSKVEKAKAKVEGTQRRGEAAPAKLEAAKVAYSKAQDDLESSQNPMNKAFAAFNVLKGSSIGQAAGAVFQGAKDFATGVKDDKPGEAIGGLLGGAGNALMATGNPIGMAAGALLKVGEAALKSVEQIREFADGLHKANMNFAEFSSSMAEVKAVRQIQEIELSQKRGERRASSAKDLSDAQMEFEQHWSYISDALANIVNALTAGVLRAMAGMASTLTGIEANTSKLPEEGTATFRSIIEEQLDLEARRRLGQDLNRPRL